MKNFPKVVFCLHALSCILSLKGKAPNIIRLSQQDLDVTKDDLRQVQSNIRGLRMPNFDNIEDGVRVNVGVGIMPIQLMEKDDEPPIKIPKPSEIIEPISPVSIRPPEPMPMYREDTPTPVETKFTTSEISEKYDAFDNSDLTKDSISQGDKDEIPQKVDFSDDSLQINDNLLHITEDFKITIPDNFQLPDFDDLDTSSVLKKERNDLIYTTSDSESDDDFEKHFLADQTIQDTNEARNLFRHYDEKIDVDVDIDAIEEKYASMIAHDNGLSINPATDRYQTYNNYETNSYTPVSFDHENYVEKSLVGLQALARGSLVRYNLFINKFMMKAFTPNVITLQAFIRGNNARKQLAKTQFEISENLMSISVLQTIVKNRGKEDKYSMVKKQLPLHETRIVELQSVVRAMQLRAKVRENRGLLAKQTQLITDLQGRIRGKLFRENKDEFKYHDPNYDSKKLPDIPEVDSTIIDAETIEETPPPQKIKVVELRIEKKEKKSKKKKKKEKKEKERKPKIIKVQKIESDEEPEGLLEDDGASSQVTAVDRSKRREPPPLSKPKPKPKPQLSQIDFSRYDRSITLLQAVARGGFTRNRLNAYVDKIYDNRHIFRSFAAIARGHLVRRELMVKKRYLQKNRGSVKVIQSTFRGVLSRFYTELFLDRLDMESDSVIALQSIFRASRVRNKIRERDAWFRRPENVAKIIKIQSFFRSARAANDFRSLINEKNPPLKAVKNFIGLLSASDVDIEDELNIEKYKEQIVQETKRIEKWEHDLSQLGVKLQLLKRNKISLEEVINFKDDHLSLSEYSHNLNDNLNRSLSANPNSKIAEKSVANLSKLYGKLFYLLQTKPIYLSNILTCLDQNPKVDLDLSTGNIEDWIMRIFNYGEVSINTPVIPDREEFLLMKLVVHSSGQFIENVDNSLGMMKLGMNLIQLPFSKLC
ncbi:unnamed protein product [Ambrosiozyma monospora]|uniref:Unnamed protein product n=1 Tax=Ambrosiozyma monospora TaxID=43982 RepID=A0A9W6Z0T5_AMBMO|nr:unnamed protein product [Ambrosiozyma monospora]